MSSIFFYPFKFLFYTLERVFTFIIAVSFIQFPQFSVQYLQRLGGHIDELSRIISRYRGIAVESGKTLENFINIHLKSGNPDFLKSGNLMLENVERLENLKNSYHQISLADDFEMPIVFIKNINFDIMKKTWLNYDPGLSFSLESFIYGIIGIIVSIIIISFFKFFVFKLMFKRR